MSKFGRQGSPAGSPQVLGAERNSKAKMLFRSLKLRKEFSPEKLCSEVARLNGQLPGKHEWMALQGARHSLLPEVTGWLLFLCCQRAQMAFAARSANLHEKRSAAK